MSSRMAASSLRTLALLSLAAPLRLFPAAAAAVAVAGAAVGVAVAGVELSPALRLLLLLLSATSLNSECCNHSILSVAVQQPPSSPTAHL
jgi:hypothetical protein